MDGFFRNFAKLAIGAVLAACVEHEPLPHETTSLRVTVTDPTDLGTAAHRLADDVRSVTVAVQALDEHGQADASLSAPIDVYVQTLGTLNDKPARLALSGGVGQATVAIPVAFGETTLWLEDFDGTGGRQPTYATGASPPLWYREPFLDDVSLPPDLTSISTALQRSQLEGKQVRVSGSRFGAAGRLVVTGVYTSGYTLSDVDCSSRPCAPTPFGHVFVFSFGRAVDTLGRPVELGQTLKWVSGGASEFNGYTELNFPDQEILDATGDLALVPDPVRIDPSWLDKAHTERLIQLEQLESALVEVDGVTVCPLGSDYDSFQEWDLDVGQGCNNPITIVTAGQVPGFDPPTALVGTTLTRVVGTLKAVNRPTFNVWIIQPRSAADITH
jgi:hypothetical protein